MVSLSNRGIPLSSISPSYLHSNSTSHIWPFSAVAELIDNAYDPDVNAKQFWIDKTMVKDQDCLIFMDNGKGMDYDKMHKMLSFGFSDKHAVRGHVPIGVYGNGFKSGSMRLGKDAIVFSKKANTMCVGLLSQTYLKEIKAENVIVPIVKFTSTGQTINAAPEHAECLQDILTHSLFNTKEELLSEFSVIGSLCTNSSGTRIIIWNLHITSSGELEFDFMKDCYDIRIPVDVYESNRKTKKRQLEVVKWMPESEYSLRAYCSILYLKPRMQIIIQGQKVETQYITKSLANTFIDVYKPSCLKKKITITFGYNTKSKEHYGLMMYYKNRLIKAYERVPCQRKAESTGVGVIGVIECNYLKPTHNKQDFDKTEEYRRTMVNVGAKLEDYWKEVRYRLKKSLNCTEPAEDIVNRPDQFWVQCDECLMWRKLPDCIDRKKLPKKWFCYMNSDPQFRSCSVEEEHEVSDVEQPSYKKTYKKDERNQKLKEQKILQPRGKAAPAPYPTSQSTCPEPGTKSSQQPATTAIPKRPSRTPKVKKAQNSLTPKPSDDPLNDNSPLTTAKRKKKASDRSQEKPEKKKARRKGSDSNISDSSECLFVLFTPASDANKAECKDIETELKGESDDVIGKSMVQKEQSNQIMETNYNDQQNYKLLYLQAMEEIKQLQHRLKEKFKNELKEEVDSLKDEEKDLKDVKRENEKVVDSLKDEEKDLKDVKRENEKVVSKEDRGVQTDCYIFYCEKSEPNSAETSNPRREQEKDSQLHTWQIETQDKSGSKRGCSDNNTQQQFLCSHACQFQCKLTNLVFEMKGKGKVMYTVMSWDKSQLQGMGQFQPAGPLYNIHCSEGSIHYLHLPHCEIHRERNQVELAVAHFCEGNMEILQPLKVTDTHVIIEVQHLSLYGLLKKWIFKETPISAQVLLFYQTIQVKRKLHIHLLPGNVPVQEVQNQHGGSTYIKCSSTCKLTPGKQYKPLCEPYISQPKVETFDYDYGPNYHPTFEVILNAEDEDIILSLLDELGEEVWAPRQVLFTAANRETLSVEKDKEAEFVDKHRASLIQRVSSVMETADKLLTRNMIRNEMYNDINEAKTPQEQMRILYRFLDDGGKAVKAEFYRVLKETNPHLVNDLTCK